MLKRVTMADCISTQARGLRGLPPECVVRAPTASVRQRRPFGEDGKPRMGCACGLVLTAPWPVFLSHSAPFQGVDFGHVFPGDKNCASLLTPPCRQALTRRSDPEQIGFSVSSFTCQCHIRPLGGGLPSCLSSHNGYKQGYLRVQNAFL